MDATVMFTFGLFICCNPGCREVRFRKFLKEHSGLKSPRSSHEFIDETGRVTRFVLPHEIENVVRTIPVERIEDCGNVVLSEDQIKMMNYHLNIAYMAKPSNNLKEVKMPEKFWVVWNENPNGVPTHKHPTRDSAMREAARMARLHTNGGKAFHVLEVFASVKKTDVAWSFYDEDIEVPF